MGNLAKMFPEGPQKTRPLTMLEADARKRAFDEVLVVIEEEKETQFANDCDGYVEELGEFCEYDSLKAAIEAKRDGLK